MRDHSLHLLEEKYQLVTEQTEQPVMKVDKDGTKRWYLNGKLHRTDGPAIEDPDSTKIWYLNGKLHRTDGPAVVWGDGTKMWYLNGKRHRTDGPAEEWANGTKKWYLNGVQYTEKEWKEKMEFEQGLKDLALIRTKFK